MILEKQLIMTIGMTANNWEVTKEMVENSIGTFKNIPIMWNKKSEFKNYNDENFNNYEKLSIIGYICTEPNIQIEDNNVYADIFILAEYSDLWKGKFDNWCLQPSDDKKSFKLCSIEVF